MGLKSSPCKNCPVFRPGKPCNEFEVCRNNPDGMIYKVQNKLRKEEEGTIFSTMQKGLMRGRNHPRTAIYSRG